MESIKIQTGGEPIIVVNSQLVSTKMMDIVNYLLTATDFGRTGGVKEFHFTENFPEGKFGGYDHKTMTVTINLQKHFDATVETIKEDKNSSKYLSLRTMLWYDLLTTICHELFHGIAWATADPDDMAKIMADPIKMREMCDECTDAANEYLIELFREYDVEATQLSEEPFFGTRFMQLYINEIKDGSDEWAVRQNIMQENQFIYYDDERDDSMLTMREWLRTCAGADPDFQDKRWDETAKQLTIVLHEEPEPEVVQTPQPVSTETEVPWKTDAEEAGETVDPEALMDMSIDDEEPSDIDSEDVVITPLPAVPAPADAIQPVAQPVQTELPLPVAAPAGAFCTKCGIALVAGNAFCGGCGTAASTAPTSTIADIRTMGAPQVVQPAVVQPVVAQPTQFTQEMRTDLPNINMDQATMRVILDQVYMRMHEHCFGKCGFQLSGGNTGNASGWNPGLSGNILQPVPIGDIPGAVDLIIACDKHNPSTQRNMLKQPLEGGTISGWVAKTSGVPHYAIYLNNNGTEVRRIFSPQNPFSLNRMKSDYSDNAKGAQVGNQISWVWIGNADGSRTWYYKVENGLAQWLV